MEVEMEDTQTNSAKKLKHSEEAITKEIENSVNIAGSTSGSLSVDHPNGSNSDLSHHDGNDEGGVVDELEEANDISDYDDNDDDYMFDDDNDDDDYDDDDDDDCDYLSMQAQFDNVDLPPGVEASVTWLPEYTTSSSKSNPSSEKVQPDAAAPHTIAGVASISTGMTVAPTSMGITVESSSNGKEKVEDVDEIMAKYALFKSFDIVQDFSDHHYSNMGFQGQQPPKAWTKKVQDEWRILEKDLPDTIFVRVYETRMDLLRAVIIGPQGTPYHDGLFVFDVYFPPSYPDIPPMVYYYSGGLRLNPNLYDCGKVCLSLLNTWTGNGNEKWIPNKSTMLQVLVSIQALILNAKPFFNEPGHKSQYFGSEGEKQSNEYNENVFILSLKTMIYTVRRPPKHFEDLVAGHFRTCAHDILLACKAYKDGAHVGSLVKGKVPDGKAMEKSRPREFKDAVSKMMNGLISNFTRYGAKDLDQFRVQP
ncbi:hypothetical protein M9H77_29826 [Catharanthus roseus]|uniref:Uncharacterized protein n=1 Tax=Catharanthus roseus TaxID=4058 RepID=A0ACB9ZWA7_CATRO|nr:hypothetical protein M9H77_29826 [Catharanthus roseus]